MPKQIRLPQRVTVRLTQEQMNYLQSTGNEFAKYLRNLLNADMSKGVNDVNK